EARAYLAQLRVHIARAQRSRYGGGKADVVDRAAALVEWAAAEPVSGHAAYDAEVTAARAAAQHLATKLRNQFTDQRVTAEVRESERVAGVYAAGVEVHIAPRGLTHVGFAEAAQTTRHAYLEASGAYGGGKTAEPERLAALR